MKFKRNIPPKVFGVDRVEYIEPNRHLLNNGIELFTMNSGDQEVVKIDFSFKAGSWYGLSRLDSTMAASMLQEGTTNTRLPKLPIYSTFMEHSFHLPHLTIITTLVFFR